MSAKWTISAVYPSKLFHPQAEKTLTLFRLLLLLGTRTEKIWKDQESVFYLVDYTNFSSSFSNLLEIFDSNSLKIGDTKFLGW